MKSAEYWHRAALLREVAIQEGATATAKDILRLYDAALNDINTEIQKIKYNFRNRYGIDEKTAAYYLTNAQREENLASLIYALESAPDERAREQILDYIHRDGLSVRAYASRIERYDAVKQSIYARVKRLAADEIAAVAAMARKAYSMNYYSVMDDTAKGLDVGINFGILNDNAITEAVYAKWNGKRFSERVWSNTDALAEEAQKLVTKSIMSGESWNKTADKLATRFQVEKFRATTLVHTEAAHAHNMADMKAYEDLGAEEYKYLATLDYATCEMCQPLDGKVFKVSEAKEGINYPVMHPRCRCTTTINIAYGSRRARNPLTGKNYKVDGDMTYNEWIKSLTPEQRQALETVSGRKTKRVSDKLDKKLAETQYRRDITKAVDNSGKSDIINMRGGRIMNINNIDSPIEQRNTGKGNPSGIVHADRPLNNRQQKLLEQLPEYDSKITVRKNEVNMKDLSALTAYTGDEFALFTKGQERLIMRGDNRSVNVDLEIARELNRQGYRWSGHTHPGISTDFATPSQGDRDILECFNQKTSVIYNSLGKYRTFEKE